MSILQIRYCPRCEGNTYHRFQNGLRCRFTRETRWQCVSCDQRERELRRRADPLAVGQDTAAEPGRS